LVGLIVRFVRVNSGTGDRLVGVTVRGLRVNRGTGDRLVGLSVRGVRVNIHLSVAPRLKASVAVTVLGVEEELFFNFPVRTAHQRIFLGL
jgi:hypothetical protein